MTFKDKWETFVITEYRWQLEGRYSVIADDTLMFHGCPLPFRAGSELTHNRGVTGVVEVTGKIVNGPKGLLFQVEKLVGRPRDLDRLKAMRFGIDTQKPQQWYELADWARGRGAFYSDPELVAAATDLDRNGILIELRQLAPDDPQGFQALLQKARDKQLDAALILQMQHDALRGTLATLKGSPFNLDAYRQLQIQIETELPGSREPLAVIPAELQVRYQAEPNGVFADSDAEQRQVLARLFFLEVVEITIRNTAAADGSNGYQIADQVAAQAPERRDMIKEYEDLADRWRMQRLNTFTRAQLEEFLQRLDKQGKKEKSHDVRVLWLMGREPFFRQEGARGLADLAQQWLAMLGDEKEAARLYIDAWKENREYAPALEWLKSRGYSLVENTWKSPEELAQMPLSPRELAIREGRVEPGMTAAQVQSALGVVPTSMTRVVSRKQITEWWVYQEAEIVIEFRKTNLDRESAVVKVDRLPARRTLAP